MNYYQGKKVLITGHTGFKGSWLSYVLFKYGAILKGYSLIPDTSPSLFKQIESIIKLDSIIGDINEAEKIEKVVLDFQPDFIFHLAAQPLVRKSYREPLKTFTTNIIGTANLLNATRILNKKCTVVIITTDKVYENKEWYYPYRETDQLGGYDPYSASKAASEIIISSYRNSFFNLNSYKSHLKGIVSVRAGNVIGGGDWSEDRLIPDIVRSIISDNKILIRNPNAVRPWQHVLEPIFGYLKIGELLDNDAIKYSGSWNFGPENSDNLPVIEIVKYSIAIWGKGEIDLQYDLNTFHEAGILKLDISKAQNNLGWKPKMKIIESIEKTISWYKNYYEKKYSISELMDNDIIYYQSLINYNI